jgi:hypothetical protein
MTEQQRRDEEVEGHAYRWDQDTEATEEDQVADDTCSARHGLRRHHPLARP